MYRPEAKLNFEKRLMNFNTDVLKALLIEFKSTKNALLIDQKMARTPEAIAERDGAISVIDVIILKIEHIIRQSKDSEILD